MIGQLRNNFKKIGTTVVLSAAAMPMTAIAESVSVELVTTDWLIFIKSENSVLTELSRHMQGPAMTAAANTTLNLNSAADKFEQNYLYILVGNRLDGMEPYLAGKLSGSKSIITGGADISVMETGFKDVNAPVDISLIQEIIEGDFGGGTYAATAATRVGGTSKSVNGDMMAAAWSAGQNENGAVNVFRIPYSAILNLPSETNENGNGGVTVNVDVGGILGSLFGNKNNDTPSKDLTLSEDNTSTVTEDSTPNNSATQVADNSDSQTTSNPIIITPDPIIITEYIQDPDLLRDRNRLRDERSGMIEYIDGLTEVIKGHENTTRDLRNELVKKTNTADSTMELLKERDTTIGALQLQLSQKSPVSEKKPTVVTVAPPLQLIPLLAGGLGLLGLGGLLGFLAGRRRKTHPEPVAMPALLPSIVKNLPKRKDSSTFETLQKGMCFSASPMALGGLPLSLAIIKPVYDAVGRIGFAQKGKPVGKDESFGTGILISERHILTNRHVWEMFKHRIASDEPTGIEFYGEKESDKSDFVTFADVEPVCVEGWDAAILTLSRAPENRKPVTITPHPAERLHDLDIVVVGYPQAHRMTEDIEAVTEKDPIFGVKRYSEGKVFRHSVDIENPYGVEAAVESIINPTEAMRAICHNASTLGGSSGSAVVCKKTGELIALHFGFDSAYEWEEAANFAVAGENLADKVAKITNAVTSVTDNCA